MELRSVHSNHYCTGTTRMFQSILFNFHLDDTFSQIGKLFSFMCKVEFVIFTTQKVISDS